MNDATSRAPRFGSITATTEKQPLPALGYRFVKLYHRLLLENGTENTIGTGGGGLLLYGSITSQVFELNIGEESQWIPIENLDQIYVRTSVGASVCAFLGSNVAT